MFSNKQKKVCNVFFYLYICTFVIKCFYGYICLFFKKIIKYSKKKDCVYFLGCMKNGKKSDKWGKNGVKNKKIKMYNKKRCNNKKEKEIIKRKKCSNKKKDGIIKEKKRMYNKKEKKKKFRKE
ncbi:hypothetical protein RFI_25504 [Reticulomyxa filosa]|uniref:Uncharacterized protein n=1 Tax=Reticulomyxa filosa TaxID=46433 RepID=X6ME20_RETFI|nr:hypothetical protein RFI_25504 [Reticulomyxa filosa]|eukprot:ETO11871.1 hypothetical protein RFI_25504 [Reticulomyxa filosa]